ncbi:hypothetical protein [Schaalia suimastitidis]|uniref:hypothetical protein n=1 Tax=Schaalia suimastitidis TaxID=121163 RepID=UPI00041C4B72|nr:hypothetical protein [Schaalia suimastitidis]
MKHFFHPQVNGQTCGIAALATFAARCGQLPAYADPKQAEAIQLRLHQVASRVGVPWPRALGTSPWALAHLASAASGVQYRAVPWNGRTACLLDEAVAANADTFLYVGGAGRPLDRFVPRHVVVVLGAESAGRVGSYAVFEPSSGAVYDVAVSTVRDGSSAGVAAFGNWRHVLAAVVPG